MELQPMRNANASEAGEILFVQEALKNYSVVTHEWWLTEAKLVDSDITKGASRFYMSVSSSATSAQVYLKYGDTSVLLEPTSGGIVMYIGANSREEALMTREYVRQFFPELHREDHKVTMKFWTMTSSGPQSRSRRLEVPAWDEISENYTAEVQTKLARLLERGQDSLSAGQLILWTGPPGTGKTYGLRSLTREWRDWCEFHYIVDPDHFFGSQADYMMQVLLSESENMPVDPDADPNPDKDRSKWKLIILEDAGELMSADARERSGQGLSRLLNTVDGMIGQGLKVFILVTTNEPLKRLHEAVARPGRCAARIEFKPLTPEETQKWLEGRGITPVQDPRRLVELYAEVEDFEDAVDTTSKLGFS